MRFRCGEGVSGAPGLGGLTNGAVIRAGAVQLGKRACVARRYLEWTLPLGGDAQPVARTQDQLPATQAAPRPRRPAQVRLCDQRRVAAGRRR